MIRFDQKAIVLLVCAGAISFGLVKPAWAQELTFVEASGSPIPVGKTPSTVAVGDFNNDGIPDLAVANTGDNSVTILLGKGDGTFGAGHSYGTTPFGIGQTQTPISIAVGDFNGDGNADLAVSTVPTGFLSGLGGLLSGNAGGGVSILLGKGDGTFTGGGPFSNPNNFGTNGNLPSSIAIGRFNTSKDQNLDLVVTNLNSANVSIMLGDGSGNFNTASNSPVDVSNNPTSVAVGDFN